jgi:prophage regulatory protein
MIEEKSDLPPGGLIRLPRVCRESGLGRSSIYAYVKTGAFPKPVRVGVRAVAWVQREVDEWVARRIAQRDAGGE